MKKLTGISFIISLSMMMGCGQNGEKPKKKTEKIISKDCFIAIYEGDTARMQISYLKDEKVKGELKIDYANDEINDGDFVGKLKGDTLFLDYHFANVRNAKKSYLNPLALLKRGDSLTMGIGQIETTLGRSYFVRGKAINFERAKFVFQKAECK